MTGCRLSLCSDVLRDLLPFAQFEKREKHPWEVLHLGNFTKINTPSWLFSRFLNCRNGAKLRKTSCVWVIEYSRKDHVIDLKGNLKERKYCEYFIAKCLAFCSTLLNFCMLQQKYFNTFYVFYININSEGEFPTCLDWLKPF